MGDPSTAGRPDPTAAPYGLPRPPGSPGGPPPPDECPPTTEFPATDDPAAYDPAGHDPTGYEGTPPRPSNVPIVAVILAVTMLLCAGTVTAAVLAVNAVADRATKAVKPIAITPPQSPPTGAPATPRTAPRTPDNDTGIPGLPSLPFAIPQLPGQGSTTATVTYEVTGDGPADILYLKRLGDAPEHVRNAHLPWRKTIKMEGTTLVMVTAVRAAPETGSIGCRATVDGDRVAQREREGSYVTVTCSKLVTEQ